MAIVIPVISTFDSKGVSKAIASFKQLDGAGQKSAFALLNGTKAANGLGKSIAKMGGIVGGIGAVIGGTLINAALESEKVSKQTEAIVKATGGAANLSTKQISDMAQAMSFKTGIDDEAIQSSMNLILTFKQVRDEVGAGNDIFTRASAAALDLGNVFGSTDGAAKQLGKALSDPVKGITALKKAGINFTDAQKEQIKTLVATGHTLEAQKLILKEVESQVGGTAAATATDFDRMKVAVGNVAEDLGKLLLPAFEGMAKFVTDKIVPIFQEFSDIVGTDGLGAGFKYLGTEGLKALGKLNGWKDLVYGVVTAMIALNVATGIYTTLQTLATIAMSAFGTAATGTAVAMNAAFFGIPALIGAVVVIVTALALRFKGFRDVLGKMVPVLQFVVNFFLDAFVNPIIWGVNQLIKAYNGIPLLSDIPLLTELHVGSDKAKKSVQSLGDELVKLKPKLNLSAGGLTPKTPKTTGGGGGGGGDGEETALEKLRKKMKAYSDLLLKVKDYQDAFKDAVKNTTSANKDLDKATTNLTKATEAFNKVSQGYGAGSDEAKTAQEELNQANRDATRAGFDLEEANFAVTNAETALTEARANGNATEIRQAEIDLAEAKMTVEERTVALTTATTNAATAQSNLNGTISGFPAESTKYTDSLSLLQEAQQQQVDATDRVNEAKKRELETTNKLIAATEELAKKKLGITKKQAKSIAKSLKAQGITITDEMWNLLGIKAFAKGGIVNTPTLGLVGEAGAEAIIPLDQFNKMNKMGNMGGGMNITINTGVGDPVAIGKAVVSSLQAYEKRFGNLPIKVA